MLSSLNTSSYKDNPFNFITGVYEIRVRAWGREACKIWVCFRHSDKRAFLFVFIPLLLLLLILHLLLPHHHILGRKENKQLPSFCSYLWWWKIFQVGNNNTRKKSNGKWKIKSDGKWENRKKLLFIWKENNNNENFSTLKIKFSIMNKS